MFNVTMSFLLMIRGFAMRFKYSLLLAGCIVLFTSAHAQSADFTHYGNFKHMMHTGDTKGQVLLSAVPSAPGVWGVGALAGLKGEIIQVDGKLLVSLGTDPKGAVNPPAPTDSAVLWASGQVTDWDSRGWSRSSLGLITLGTPLRSPDILGVRSSK